MNIDALNLTLTHLKSVGIDAFDKVNNVVTTVPPTSLAFTKASMDEGTLLIDVFSKSGVIMKKFALASLFPKTIDIRPYKQKLTLVQKSLSVESNAALNNKYSTNLTVVDPAVINTASSFDEASIRDFLTFCRVFGFFDLTLRDVHLETIDGKLIISVNSTHDYFTGFIEVLV